MKRKYCYYLNHGINFYHKGLIYCNKIWKSDVILDYDKDFLNNFFKERERILNDLDNGIAPKNCEKCMYLENIEDNLIVSNKIKYIEVYHWTQCNCACFYCSNRDITKLKVTQGRNNKGAINLLNVLKKLDKQKLLDEDLEILIVGGEPTILNEFPALLKFFIKHRCKVNLLSNGIIYEKYISKTLLETELSSLIISLDCGTRETFKKIKGVDKFDEVVKNIKRYIEDTKEHSSRIEIKYIILNGVNDNKEEIDKWIDLCVSLGVKNLFPTIEFCHSVVDPKNSVLTDNVCEMYQYAKERIKSLGKDITLSTYDFVEKIIEERTYDVL